MKKFTRNAKFMPRLKGMQKVKRSHFDMPMPNSTRRFKHTLCHYVIWGGTIFLLTLVILGTGYRDRKIAQTCPGEMMMKLLESTWIHVHGASRRFSADQDFYVFFFSRSLKGHNIQLCLLPNHSPRQDGYVKHSEGVLKTILTNIKTEQIHET